LQALQKGLARLTDPQLNRKREKFFEFLQ
jgi:hypothetical protein